MFGLKESDIQAILSVLADYAQVEQAFVFGSRAKGNYRPGSDVDIALKGLSITFSTIQEIGFRLNEESLMPYKFDILNYNTIQNEALKSHIDRVGTCFYTKNPLIYSEDSNAIKQN
ncbi:MAG: nucleotidyltransferase family protein [Bacteroidales bacterium]